MVASRLSQSTFNGFRPASDAPVSSLPLLARAEKSPSTAILKLPDFFPAGLDAPTRMVPKFTS
jgi:hypothetical protein